MVFRFLKVLLSISPLVLAFLRDRRRYVLFGPPRELSEERHRERAVRLTRRIAGLGPAFIKLAQVFGSRADILPPVYLQELSKLHDQVPPFPTSQLKRRVEEELGRPLDQIFTRLSEEPLAAASLGQVHRATYRGTDVVVKVLRPGVEQILDLDIAIVRRILSLLEYVFPETHHLLAARTILDEFSRVIRDEMNFLKEAENAETFQRLFSRDSQIIVPEVFREVTTRRVIVLRYYQGIPVDEVDRLVALGIDMDKIVRRLIEFYSEQVLVHGLFHADPHPGNILITPEGSIIVVDYGMVLALPESVRKQLLETAVAAVRQDLDLLVQGLYDLDLIAPDVSPGLIREAAREIIGIHYKVGLTHRQIQEITHHVLRTFYRFPLRMPSSLVYMFRAAALVEGIGIRSNPEFNAIRDATPIVRGMLSQLLGPPEKQIWGRIKAEALGLYRLLKNVQSVFQRADRDLFLLRIHPRDIDGMEKFFTHTLRRVLLAFGLSVWGFLVAVLYVTRIHHPVFLAANVAFLAFAFLLIFLLPNPHRYYVRQRRLRRLKSPRSGGDAVL